jgi:hypothetical protein
MKRAVILSIILALCTGAAVADLVYLLEIEVNNQTGEIIEKIHIRPDYGGEWEEIAISEWVIRPGESYTLQIRDYKYYNTDVFDVRVESRSGQTYTLAGQDLVSSNQITFRPANRD